MKIPYSILTKRALLGLGTSLMVATSTIGVTAVNFAPSAYAATTQQQTNLAQFTNLVGYLNQLNSALVNEGTPTYNNVQTFADKVYGASNATWGSVLYGNTYNNTSTQNAAIQFIRDMVSLILPTSSSIVSYPLQPTTTFEHQITTKLNTDLGGVLTTPLTGTDLYNFYESFRAAVIAQIPSLVLGGGSSQSLTQSILDPALESAVSNNPVFKGILGDLGLSVSQIATYRQNFTTTFTAQAGYGIGAAAALNDVVASSINTQYNGAPITNGTLSLTLGNSGEISLSPGSDLGSVLQSFQIPSKWITVTSSNPSAVSVTQNATSSAWIIQAVGSGSAVLSITLRGYTLNSINVIAASSTSTGGGSPTPPPSTGGGTSSPTTPAPTSPTATVSGTVGTTLTTAVLGSNGTQIQVSVPGTDVSLPISVQMNALTSLPTSVTAISGVVQAISLDAQTTPSGTTTSGTTTSGTAVHYFDHPVTITFTLPSAPTAPISIVFWNALTKSWQPISNFSVNQSTVTMTTTHFTTFAVVNASSVSSVNRIEGQRAIDTAIKAAQSAYPDGANSVVLAFAGTKTPSPDALSAAGLAGSLHAPLLLTEQNQLDPAVLQSIQSLGAKTIYVLGGKGAISDNVVNALTQAGLSVVRDFQGKTLYDTSMLIDQYMVQNKLTNASTVFIANGQTMIDALSASPVAYQQGAPIMLVQTGQQQLTATQLAFLQSANIKNAVVLGGNYVVSPAIENQLTQSLGATNVMRLGGKTMNDTAVAIDQNYFPNATGAVISSNGTPNGSFVDALSASAFAANNNVPILLTNQTGLPNATAQYLSGQKSLHAIWVMGGSQAVVPGVNQTLSADIQSTN